MSAMLQRLKRMNEEAMAGFGAGGAATNICWSPGHAANTLIGTDEPRYTQ